MPRVEPPHDRVRAAEKLPLRRVSLAALQRRRNRFGKDQLRGARLVRDPSGIVQQKHAVLGQIVDERFGDGVQKRNEHVRADARPPFLPRFALRVKALRVL